MDNHERLSIYNEVIDLFYDTGKWVKDSDGKLHWGIPGDVMDDVERLLDEVDNAD